MRRSRAFNAALVLVAALTVAGTVGCGQTTTPKGPGPTPATPEALLVQLKDDRARIDQTSELMIERLEQFNRSRQPGQRTIQFSEAFSEELSPEQRDVLNTLLEQEQDVSYRALLQTIIADRDSIRGLQERILRLEQSLPERFALAKKGDTHRGLAAAFLTGEAEVDRDTANRLLASVDLSDELLPGNKVWFFHDAAQGAFRTYVTQGEAGQTPLAVRRALKRRLITERDEARAQVVTLQDTRASLEATNAGLVASKSRLESDVRGLQERKTTLEGTVERLSSDLAFRQNSLFYHAANEDTLKQQGVLSSVLKRLQDVKGVEFDSALDLRQANSITLRPGTFGLDRIREVRLLPPIFQEGRDFAVETSPDASSARVVILDPGPFRGKEVVLAVGG